VRLQLLGIEEISFADRLKVFFNPLTVEAGLLKILCGANEGARLATDRAPQSAEGSPGFWSEKDESFFGLIRNNDEDAFVVHRPAPGFDTGKPGIRRGICSATKKRNDHQITHRLAVG
jgi:hypothetical protein